MATPRPFRDGWRVQIQKDGQRVSRVFRTKREAAAWATEQEAKKTPLRANTLGQAVKRYLETVTIHKRNATGRESGRFDAFMAYIGENTPLSEIDTDLLARWRDDRLKTVSGSTVVREVNLYRNLFRTAAREWKWIPQSPFEGLRLPKENAPRDAVWRWQEIRRVIRAGQARGGKTGEVTQAFRIALHTSMRLQECLNFSFDGTVITIPPSKTNDKPERIPTLKRARRVLAALPHSYAVGPNEASTLFSKLCKQLLIEGKTFHDARATALTWMARRVEVLTLSKISRHKDLSLLMRTYYRESAEQISARL